MKTKLCMLIIMSVLCFMNTQAELKYFLPTSNAYISIYNCGTAKYFFEGDTIIQEKRYTKVYTRECYSEIDECKCDKYCYYYGAVREDTIAEKIYFISDYGRDPTKERVVADFSVKEGDNVIIDTLYYGETTEVSVHIESVDSILIGNEYRKRVNISTVHIGNYWWDITDDSWVEGIGSIVYGLFDPYQSKYIVDVCIPKFLCLHIDDELVYKDPNYNTCYVPRYTDGFDEKMNPSVYIYPTMVDKTLFIAKNERNYLYNIYNMQGINIKSGVLRNNIDVSNLTPGLYYIILYDKNKKVYSQKIVKL